LSDELEPTGPSGNGAFSPDDHSGNVRTIDIEYEMRGAYLDYAMSVIVARALPDVRDGLKPVHRRILYSMQINGNVWNRGYVKSARVTGEVMGKYHPHGNQAIYDAMARLAQSCGFGAKFRLYGRIPLNDYMYVNLRPI